MTTATESLRICAIIPAFREAARITPVIAGVRAQGLAPVVVDDGSGDGTAEAAEAAGAVVVRHPVNKGKGAALQTGFAFAREQGFAWIVTMDADGQHAPDDLPAFLEAIRRGDAEVVVGNRMRDVHDMPWIRRATNWIMSAWLSRIMRQRVPDTQCGYRAYHATLLPHLVSNSTHFDAESEVLIRLARRGFRIASVPIRTIYGDEKSKIRPVRDTLRFIKMLWRLRATTP
jgi:glycosyltransferase involved in cell wall biosynthesis